MKSWQQILIGVVGGLLGTGILLLINSQPRGEPVKLIPPPTPTVVRIQVHVSGAVINPDIYLFSPGSRVRDAIEAAGGLHEDANPGSLNLAAVLIDEQKISIPFINSSPSNIEGEPSIDSDSPQEVVYPININTATQEMLEELPSIGPVTAAAIIEYREQTGQFTSIEQIINVSGIGSATLEKIKDLISVK